MEPIFMIGTQRSGSNLLRVMLNQLPEIASPHPPHVLERITPLLGFYGDLADEDNFSRMVDDVCRLVELNPVGWDGVDLNRATVKARCRDHSLAAVYGAVYDQCALAHGAKTWCCKSLANIAFVDEIERYFKTPKYIYLYRDGRDVALSFRKALVGEKHFYHIAKVWAELQETALALRDRLPPQRLISVSYEDITGDPEGTARRLCAFLGVEYNEGMLEFHRSKEAARTAESSTLWGNVTRPLMKDNTRKFLRDASEEDIRIFESVAGHVLDRLGYDRVFVRRGEEQSFTEAQIRAFSEENERLKTQVRNSIDADDMERRRRQEALLEEIKSRPLRVA